MLKGGNGRSVVLIIAIAFVATACAWGQAGGNAARNGGNPFEPGLTTDNVDQLALAWQADNAAQVDAGPVMNAKYVFTTEFGFVNAYAAGGPASAAGATHCSGSPSVCTPVWFARASSSAPASAPVVSGDRLFVSAFADGLWSLLAYDADPASCPATANGCEPLWTGRWGTSPQPRSTPSIAVSDGRVYVATPPDAAGGDAYVTVFDEAGINRCSAGPPRTCSPLFQATTDKETIVPPAVAAGRLFVQGTDATLVFDAAGQTGCNNGSCSPLYRLASGAARGVSLFGTTAYAATGTVLMAFDATCATGCAGSPIVCQPKWTAMLGALTEGDTPTVSNGKVFVVALGDALADPALKAFDAAGVQGCGGSPVLCEPLFDVARASMAGVSNHLSATPSVLVMSGWSVIPFNPPILTQTLKTFDLSGSTNCSGTPKRCSPLSTSSVGTDIGISSPAVAFGRIALSDSAGHLKVFAVPG